MCLNLLVLCTIFREQRKARLKLPFLVLAVGVDEIGSN